MPSFQYTSQVQAEYQRLFDTCVINPDRYPDVDAAIKMIIKNQSRYEAVSATVGVPWYFIGLTHYMEGGCDFTTHLHNGDPLTARTIQVPKGRPVDGTPPFTWEASAEDAMIYEDLNTWGDWSIPGVLYKLEGYNGYGYHKSTIAINSPYLWSFSNLYTKGKFVSDGQFSPTAVSKQCGAGVLLRRMVEKNLITPGITDRLTLIKQLGPEVTFNPSRYNAKAEELQQIMNLAGAYLKVDGKAGRITSDAYHSFTGSYLTGDTAMGA